jgi:hypothetical protein
LFLNLKIELSFFLKWLGVAGASYVPSVQAALPRILSSAAPPVAGARENRRQCLKVTTSLLTFLVLISTGNLHF